MSVSMRASMLAVLAAAAVGPEPRHVPNTGTRRPDPKRSYVRARTTTYGGAKERHDGYDGQRIYSAWEKRAERNARRRTSWTGERAS